MKSYYKLSDINGSYLRKLYRALGGNTAIILEKTPIKPNQVTILSTVLAFVSFGFIYFSYYLAAAIFLFLSMVLDKADGSLARLRNTSTSLGNWLDSTTDYIQITIMFLVLALHFQNIYPPRDSWIVTLGAIIVYNATKYLFVFFKKYFAEHADTIVEQEKEKHPLRSCFHFNELFVNNTMFIALLAAVFKPILLYYLTILFVAYGIFFFVVMYIIFTYQAHKQDRRYCKDEQLKTKF